MVPLEEEEEEEEVCVPGINGGMRAWPKKRLQILMNGVNGDTHVGVESIYRGQNNVF